MDHAVYHVMLEGRRVGPYDRRTIVGMRVKKALASDNVLIGADGSQLTVADLIRRRSPTPFNSERSGSYSVVKGSFAAWLVEFRGKGIDIPRFKGEIEARLQADGVVRLAGRFRRGFGWKDGRVKIPVKDVVRVRVKGSQVELGLGGSGERPAGQCTLELFTPESAREFADGLPGAARIAGSSAAGNLGPATASRQAVWMAAISVVSVAMVVAVMLFVVLYRGGR